MSDNFKKLNAKLPGALRSFDKSEPYGVIDSEDVLKNPWVTDWKKVDRLYQAFSQVVATAPTEEFYAAVDRTDNMLKTYYLFRKYPQVFASYNNGMGWDPNFKNRDLTDSASKNDFEIFHSEVKHAGGIEKLAASIRANITDKRDAAILRSVRIMRRDEDHFEVMGAARKNE